MWCTGMQAANRIAEASRVDAEQAMGHMQARVAELEAMLLAAGIKVVPAPNGERVGGSQEDTELQERHSLHEPD